MSAMASAGIAWGNVPEWIAGVGTVLLLVGAIWAGAAAGGQLKVLRSEATARAEEQKRFQASRVSAWLDRTVNGEFLAMFVNKNGLPVFEVTIGFVSPSHDTGFRFPVLAPIDKPIDVPSITRVVQDAASRNPNIKLAWVMPSDVKQPVKSLVEQEDGSNRWEPTAMTGPLGLTITFTDMQGFRWHRDLRGVLEEVDLDFKVVRSAVIFGEDPLGEQAKET